MRLNAMTGMNCVKLPPKTEGIPDPIRAELAKKAVEDMRANEPFRKFKEPYIIPGRELLRRKKTSREHIKETRDGIGVEK